MSRIIGEYIGFFRLLQSFYYDSDLFTPMINMPTVPSGGHSWRRALPTNKQLADVVEFDVIGDGQ